MEEDNHKEERKIDRTPVFYYSRERRLEKASAGLQAYYANEEKARTSPPGFAKRVFGSRRNIFFFVPILLVCVMVAINNRLDKTQGSVKLGGNSVTAVITSEEGTLIMDIIKKIPKSGQVYLGAVEVAVSPVMPKPNRDEVKELPPVYAHRVIFTAAESESYIVSLPFSETDFLVIFRTSEEYKSMKLKAIDVISNK